MLQVKEQLGDFEIIRLLGKGGMGEVYEARQRHPDRPVALKVLAPWLAGDKDALQRFMREAQVPANLDHPGIVRIISTGSENGVAYYAMHLVRGLTLAELIRRGVGGSRTNPVPQTEAEADTPSAAPGQERETGPIAGSGTPADAPAVPLVQTYVRDRFRAVARIGIQAARALAHAHRQGHLHRDIKPSNIMVDHHDQVYLVDFGLTRGLQPTADSTQPGALTGTPWYMSPEQASGHALDARSDIYSLGLTLYELATQGQGPFTAHRQDKAAVLEQVRGGQLLPARAFVPDIPAGLEKIIDRATRTSPAERYADAAALAADLEALEGPKGDDSPTQPLPAPPRARKRWPRALVAAAVLAGLMIALAAVAWRKPPDDQPPPLDGRNALPESLKLAAPNVPISLSTVKHDPVWSEILLGKGGYRLHSGKLELYSLPDCPCTLLALADPDRTEFEFSVEITYLKSFNKDYSNEIGVFFGYRRNTADGQHRYFILKLDETPAVNAPNGRVTLGTGSYTEERGARKELISSFAPVPFERATIPLPSPHAWHPLKLRVAGDRFTVSIGPAMVREFTLAEVREAAWIRDPNLGTQGAVGIWAARGRGFFRNPTISFFANP